MQNYSARAIRIMLFVRVAWWVSLRICIVTLLKVPWHQDETVDAVFSDPAVAFLRRRHPKSLLDVGFGLHGSMFPDIEFRADQIGGDAGAGCFDMVVSKDILWYVH
jgi:hypothetical protein